MSNGLYHIDGLDEMIKKEFAGIIKKANMKFLDNSTRFGDDYSLANNKCILNFKFDRGDLSCLIVHPSSNRRYYSNLVYKILYPHENDIFTFSINSKYEDQLRVYANMIEQKLMNVLEGDFSWEPLAQNWKN
jgi:hypothetical protein